MCHFNRFFSCVDRLGGPDSNLRLCDIVEIVDLFLFVRMKLDRVDKATNNSRDTIEGWGSKCRELCGLVLHKEPKLLGTASNTVQVDMSYFKARNMHSSTSHFVSDRQHSGAEQVQGAEHVDQVASNDAKC